MRSFYGKALNRLREKSTSRSVAVVVSVLVILSILGYAFGYRPYIAKKEEVARIAAEETRRVAEAAAKKAADEKVRVLEAQAKLAEERARIMEAQAKATEDGVRQAANRADAEDLARVESLRGRCNAAGAAANRSGNAAGNFMAAQLAIPICTQSERAVKDRLRYEALRSQDPAAAARELEVQRAAREARQHNAQRITSSAAHPQTKRSEAGNAQTATLHKQIHIFLFSLSSI